MPDAINEGWEDSAAAWIAAQGEDGDFTRKYVLDPVMLARVRGAGFSRALDVGGGEGRFCRMLRAEGIAAVGIDPAPSLDGSLVEGHQHRQSASSVQRLCEAAAGEGLRLTFFDEPAPIGGDAETIESYRRVPYAHVMEWRKI